MEVNQVRASAKPEQVIDAISGQRTSSKETLKEITRMRTLIVNLLATALLLFGASSASAFALTMTVNPGSVTPGTPLLASDFIIVDVYLDADPGLGFLSVAIVYDDNGTIVYEPGLSTTASYVLYAPGAGTANATYLIPNANLYAEFGVVYFRPFASLIIFLPLTLRIFKT